MRHAAPLILFFVVVYVGLAMYRNRRWPDPRNWKSTIGQVKPRGRR
jgi:hypothetical protein